MSTEQMLAFYYPELALNGSGNYEDTDLEKTCSVEIFRFKRAVFDQLE